MNLKLMNLKLIRILLTGIVLISVHGGGLVKAQDPHRIVKGKVVNANTNNPVADVTIYLEGTGIHTTSDPSGTFELVLPADGTFELIASCIGYKKFEMVIRPTSDDMTELELTLTEDPKEIGQVNIVKYIRELEIHNTPTVEPLSLALATTSISREEIRQTEAKTVIEAMAYSPGAFIETRGRKVKQFFSVRGQRYPYPEYSINGVWQREFLETPYFFSTGNVEKIEIIRSSAALLHGLSGMAGMVNIVTRKYTQPETAAELEYGSFNSVHTSLSHSGKKESLTYSLNLGYDRTDGPPGRHAMEKIFNLYGNFEWKPSEKISVTANIFHLNGMRQFMQAQYPAAPGLIGRLESYDPFVSSSVSLKVRVEQSEKSNLEIHSFYTGRRPEFINEVDSTTVSEHDSEVGLNILESVSLGSSNILRFGGLYNYWNAPNGKRYYAGRKSEVQTISWVVTDEFIFRKLNLNGGIRWVKTYINEFGAFGIDGSGSAFTEVEPIMNQWQPFTLQMTGGAVYEPDARSMISLNLVSGSVRPREGALNDNLTMPENEYRTMVDLGYRITPEHLPSMVLTGFYVNQKNAIMYSGEILELEDGRFVELYQNQDQFQYGVEFEARSPVLFKRSTTIFLNLTGMRSMIREESETIKNSELPAFIANSGMNIRLRDFDLNVYGNYSSQFFSTRFADKSVGPVPLGGYFRIDLNTGYTLGSEDNWRIYGSVKNLLNRKYSTVVGYPDPGRRFYLGLEYRFIRKKNETDETNHASASGPFQRHS